MFEIDIKKFSNQQILGQLSQAWDEIKKPKHWAHEKSKTSTALRIIGQLNKIVAAGSGTYLGTKLVVNRRGRLAASTGLALGRYSWEVIQDTLTNVLGTVPNFIKATAVDDLRLGIAYKIGQNKPDEAEPSYENRRNKYNNLKAEADRRGILPLDHAYPFENPFQEHSYTQQTLAALTTAAAFVIMQAGKADNHRGYHHKNIIAKAFGVTLQQVENFYKDRIYDGAGYYHEGPPHGNEEFANAPNQYNAPPVPPAGAAEAVAIEYAIQLAGHYANQMANGVAPAMVQDD